MIDNRYMVKSPAQEKKDEAINRIISGIVLAWFGIAIVWISFLGWLGFGAWLGITGLLLTLRAAYQARAASKLIEKGGAE